MTNDSQDRNMILPGDKNQHLALPSEMASRGLELAANIALQRNVEMYQKPVCFFAGFDHKSWIIFSGNGCIAALHCFLRENDLLLWDAINGSTTTLSTRNRAEGAICGAALSSTGEKALTSHSKAIVLLWDVKNREVINKFRIDDTAPVSQNGVSRGVIFSPDDRYFAAGNWFNVTIRETLSGREVRRFTAMIDSPNEIAFTNDGSKLAIGNRIYSEKMNCVRTMYYVDIPTGKEIRIFDEAINISSVSIFPDNRKLLTINGMGRIAIWDNRHGQIIKQWSHTGESPESSEGEYHNNPGGVAISRNGRRLLTGYCDGFLRLWNSDGVEINHYHGKKPSYSFVYPVTKVAFLSDGLHAISGHWDGSVYLWELPPL
jgi:WD40 repeat protein